MMFLTLNLKGHSSEKNKDLILLVRLPHFNSFELPTKPHNYFIKTTQLLH